MASDRPEQVNTAPRPAGPRDAGREIRTRWFGLWDGYLAVAFVVALLFLITGTGSPAGGRTVAVALLTALVPWYVALGRPAVLVEDRARGARFAAGLLVGFAGAVLADQAATFALFAVAPLLTMSLPLPIGFAAVLGAHLWPLVCAMLRATVSTGRCWDGCPTWCSALRSPLLSAYSSPASSTSPVDGPR
ncbi:hypothetical protein ACWDT6_16790 [Nocardia grenadensis]